MKTVFLLGFGDVFLDRIMWNHLDSNKTQQFADDNPKQKNTNLCFAVHIGTS